MSKQRKSYTKTEKLEIVKLSFEEGETIKNLSERFGISGNTIYSWRSKYLKSPATAFPGNGNKEMTETEKELHELKKQLRESQLENEILKKAVGIFSKTDKKSFNL